MVASPNFPERNMEDATRMGETVITLQKEENLLSRERLSDTLQMGLKAPQRCSGGRPI